MDRIELIRVIGSRSELVGACWTSVEMVAIPVVLGET